jgi:hypothetical protein
MIEEEQQHLMNSSMQLGEREVGQLIKRLIETAMFPMSSAASN